MKNEIKVNDSEVLFKTTDRGSILLGILLLLVLGGMTGFTIYCVTLVFSGEESLFSDRSLLLFLFMPIIPMLFLLYPLHLLRYRTTTWITNEFFLIETRSMFRTKVIRKAIDEFRGLRIHHVHSGRFYWVTLELLPSGPHPRMDILDTRYTTKYSVEKLRKLAENIATALNLPLEEKND